MTTTHSETKGGRASLIGPAIVLGLGLGGFLDGIVLHQIVQWHNMLSSTDRWPATTMKGMEANMRADGLFHAATWILVALGLWMLWRAMRNGAHGSGQAFVGWMLAGWHVREGGNELAWDLGFLTFGLALVIGGWLIAKAADEPRLREQAA
jgi:uncharacterized membrane protein